MKKCKSYGCGNKVFGNSELCAECLEREKINQQTPIEIQKQNIDENEEKKNSLTAGHLKGRFSNVGKSENKNINDKKTTFEFGE